MSFENPTNTSPSESEEQRLDLEHAQEEANMMHRERIDREGYPHAGDKAPTAEDYQQAFEAVEEIRRLAEEEPASEKMLLLIAQKVQEMKTSGRLLLEAMKMVGIFGGDREADNRHEAMMERLKTAGQRLKELKEGAGTTYMKGSS